MTDTALETAATAPSITVHRSLLTLNANHRLIRNALTDAHDLHRLVMLGFRGQQPDGTPSPRANLGVLFTHRPTPHGAVQVLIQAHTAPDWTCLPAAALCGSATTHTVTLTATAGQWLRFEITTPPTRSVSKPPVPGQPRARGTRKPITDPDEQVNWLAGILHRNGLDLVQAEPGGTTRIASEKKSLPTEQRSAPNSILGFRMVKFTGTARIVDPHAYVQAMSNGIGTGKSYGGGLLLTQAVHPPTGRKSANHPAQHWLARWPRQTDYQAATSGR